MQKPYQVIANTALPAIFTQSQRPSGLPWGDDTKRSQDLPLDFFKTFQPRLAQRGPVLGGLLVVLALAGCAAPPPLADNDPNEADNRAIHQFNVAVDKAVLSPVAGALGGAAKGPIGEGVSNIATNLSMPSSVANKLLQGNLVDAVHNTVRFAVNTTVGIGGLFDPASAIGLEARKSDFGATLHIWGAPEGDYAELPFIGPSTSRDTLGMIVDFAIDPLGLFLPADLRDWARVAKYGSKLGDRARFSSSVDSILHESADSYAQTRLLYLQSRRFELGQEVDGNDFIDPYE